MPAAVTYTTVLGQVLMENRGGIVTEFVPDPLGSVVKHKDSTGAYVHSAEYWPYGEIQTSTGNLPGPLAYCGTWGYYRDSASQTYVRARYYRPVQGRWMTVDPFWPLIAPFKYCRNQPLATIDPSGKVPKTCTQIWNCLSESTVEPPFSEGNPCKCGRGSPVHKADKFITVCMFRRECGSRDGSTIDPDNCIDDKGGGLGQITPGAVNDLKRWCCNEGIDNPWSDGASTGNNWCKAARAARNYLTCVGLERYGPPYTAAQMAGITACADCLRAGGTCADCFKNVV